MNKQNTYNHFYDYNSARSSQVSEVSYDKSSTYIIK